MVNLNELPQGLDFSLWKETLDNKVSGACVGHHNKFYVPKLQWGKQVFESYYDLDAANGLSDYLIGTGSLTGYTNHRWGEILLVVIGFVVFLWAVMGYWLYEKSKKQEKRIKKGFLDMATSGLKTEQITGRMVLAKYTREDSSYRSTSLTYLGVGLTLFSIIAVCVLAVFDVVGTSQALSGMSAASCGMWMQIRGHFFGAGEYSGLGVPIMWKGTQPLIDGLNDISSKTVPGPMNPIFKEIVAQKPDVMDTLKQQYAMFQGVADKADIMMEDHYQLYRDVAKNSASTYKSVVNPSVAFLNDHYTGLALYNLIMHKNTIARELINKTIVDGDAMIDMLLDKYTGTESILMNSASDAATSTKETINTINRAIANYTKKWLKLEFVLKLLGITLGALRLALFVVICVGVGLLCKRGAGLRKKIRSTASPVSTPWTAAFVCLFVAAGCAALLSGFDFLLSGIGADICEIADYDLMENGLWEILGDEVLNPVNGSEGLIRTVFDTCVRRSGDGDVAVHIGVDGHIAQLQLDVDQSVDEIHDYTDALLARGERRAQISALGQGYQEYLRSHFFRGQNAPEEIPTIHLEDRPMDTYGANNILSVLPLGGANINAASALTLMAVNGIWFSAYPVGYTYDWVNARLSEAHELANSDMPKRVCGVLGNSQRASSCKDSEDGKDDTVYLGQNVAATDIDGWVTAMKDAEYKYAHHGETIADEVGELLKMLLDAERISGATTFNYKPKSTTCDGCTYDQWRKQDIKVMESWKSDIGNLLDNMTSTVDNYVDGLIVPKMNQLITEANNLTEGANCRFEGDTLDVTVLPSLCQVMFPASSYLSIVLLLMSVMAFVLSGFALGWEKLDLELDHYNPTATEMISRYGLNTATREPDDDLMPHSSIFDDPSGRHRDTAMRIGSSDFSMLYSRRGSDGTSSFNTLLDV